MNRTFVTLALPAAASGSGRPAADDFRVTEDADPIRIGGSVIDAAAHERGYITSVAAGSFVNHKTGFHDAGFGFDIVDWLVEPGSDESCRAKVAPDRRSARARRKSRRRSSVARTLSPCRRATSTTSQPRGQRPAIRSARSTSVTAGTIAAKEFSTDFAPDARFDYHRGRDRTPRRFVRACHLRDPLTGRDGPWLAGMTLDATAVPEAWRHQRGYVCMIEEIGGRPIRPGKSFGAAFLIGYFDSIPEMERTYEEYAGYDRAEASTSGWKLLRSR